MQRIPDIKISGDDDETVPPKVNAVAVVDTRTAPTFLSLDNYHHDNHDQGDHHDNLETLVGPTSLKHVDIS